MPVTGDQHEPQTVRVRIAENRGEIVVHGRLVGKIDSVCVQVDVIVGQHETLVVPVDEIIGLEASYCAMSPVDPRALRRLFRCGVKKPGEHHIAA